MVELGREVFHYEVVGSTNDLAKTLAEAGVGEGAVIVADRQTGGKGRRGHSWYSPVGGLWASFILQWRRDSVGLVGLAAATAVAQTLDEFCCPAMIKWPNDVYVAGRKVSGVLVESCCTGGIKLGLVLGVGVNLDISFFPEDLEAKATSLMRVMGARGIPTRDELLAVLCSRLTGLLAVAESDGFGTLLEFARKRDMLSGQLVTVDDGKVQWTGLASGIRDDGGLNVWVDGRLRAFYAGDVSVSTQKG